MSKPSATELREQRTKLITDARALLTEIRDTDDVKKLADLEKRHDALMADLDKIDADLARHERTEMQERLDANYRAGRADRTDEERRAALRPNPGDTEVPAVDGHVMQTRNGWADKKGEEVRVLARTENLATERWDGPTFGECLRALVTGPRNDMEKRVLNEGSDGAGGFTVPTPLAQIYIDKLRAASVCMRAGAQTVDMTSETLAIARLASDPTMAWRAENAEITPADPTFERVLLEAKSLGGLVKVSRELLDDSVNVAAMLENAFIQSAALAFDAALLYGATGGDNPVGVAATSGINEVSLDTNGDSLDGCDDIIDAMYELELDNAPAPTAMAMHPRTQRDIRKQKDGEGQPLQWNADAARIPRLTTTAIPITETQGTASNASSIILGHFPHMLVGLRSSLRIELLKERYGEFLQIGFLAWMRGDMQLAHKASFCRIKGITPGSA